MSVASLWELINKKDKRDSPLKDPAMWWDRYVVKPGTPVLPIRSQHVLYLDRLPMVSVRGTHLDLEPEPR